MIKNQYIIVKVVVIDSSVLMDLALTVLIECTSQLPFNFVIPDTMFAQELTDLGDYNRDRLLGMGFTLGELSGDGVIAAQGYMAGNARLSLQDCFALAMAQEKEAILMTGDGLLRKISTNKGVEVHGVLWFADLIEEHQCVENDVLRDGLLILQQHLATRLPKKELQNRIDRLTAE